MDTLKLGRSEMPPEDRDFYIEFGSSAILALAIVLLA
jgi:hypothetical protein